MFLNALKFNDDNYLIKMPCDEIVQDSIAEELQSLVAVSQSVGVEGGVTEGLEQVGLVTPDVSNHVLELVETIQKIMEMSLCRGNTWCSNQR